jgi:hypothetical protein
MEGQRGFARAVISTTVVAVILLLGAAVRADEHVVDPATRDARLMPHVKQRAEDVATLRRLLESKSATRAAHAAGLDIRRVSAVVPVLSDAELRDLARRAEALNSDPRAGMSKKGRLIVLAVVVVLGVVLASFDAYP